MSGVFIKDSDVVKITVYVGNDRDGNLVVDSDKEMAKEQSNSSEDVKEINVTFRSMTYGDQRAIFSQSVNMTGQDLTVDPATLRYLRFVNMIKDWDLTDENGRKINPTEDNIQKLHPRIAEIIMSEYEKTL